MSTQHNDTYYYSQYVYLCAFWQKNEVSQNKNWQFNSKNNVYIESVNYRAFWRKKIKEC